MTFFAGDTLPASALNDLLAPGWTDYSGTFTLTATTTNPTKGNSTYLARYRRPDGSDKVDVEIYILIGSTFAAGSGLYRFLLPVAASANAILSAVGAVYVADVGTAGRTAVARILDATHVECLRNGDASVFTNTLPQTWATGDIIQISISYEAA
jgi:hypothetical protein